MQRPRGWIRSRSLAHILANSSTKRHAKQVSSRKLHIGLAQRCVRECAGMSLDSDDSQSACGHKPRKLVI